VHVLMDDPLVETVITLLTPFAAFIPAEALHASGVLAVVAMGLYVSRHSHAIFSPPTRLQVMNFWQVTVFVLNGLVFVLVGLQLPIIVEHTRSFGEKTSDLLLWSIGLCIVMALVRFVWVFPATYLPRLLSRRMRERDSNPPWQWIFVIAFTAMRGATSLAAAVALPLTIADGQEFPRRSLIIFLTFTAILGTLVLQSLMLPGLVSWLGVRGAAEEDRCEEWDARRRAARAALAHINELEKTANESNRAALARLRQQYEQRIEELDRIGDDEVYERHLVESGTHLALFRKVLTVERKAIVNLRDKNLIGDEVLWRIEHDLDLQESRLLLSAEHVRE